MAKSPTIKNTIMEKIFQIQNLKCSGCENTVFTTLEKQPGITVINVSAENSSLTIEVKSEELLEIIT